MRIAHRGPSSKNLNFCGYCLDNFESLEGGADIEASVLFADVRGSTRLSQRLPAAEYGRLMSRYYTAARDALVPSDALIDKLVGDQVVGPCLPGFAGAEHPRQAIEAGRALLQGTGHGDGQPWIPVGGGVHTGTVYVGLRAAAGQAQDIWATGEAMNTAARLSSEAAPGELLVSAAAFTSGGLSAEGLELRRLPLKGLDQPIEVHVLTAPAPPGGAS